MNFMSKCNELTERNVLLGRQFEGSIGEPWNFVSSAGSNVLTGTLVDLSTRQRPHLRLLLDVVPFTYSGIEIRQIFASNRYEPTTRDMLSALAAGKSLTMNMGFHKDGRIIPTTAFESFDFERVNNDVSFLIGELKLVPHGLLERARSMLGFRA